MLLLLAFHSLALHRQTPHLPTTQPPKTLTDLAILANDAAIAAIVQHSHNRISIDANVHGLEPAHHDSFRILELAKLAQHLALGLAESTVLKPSQNVKLLFSSAADAAAAAATTQYARVPTSVLAATTALEPTDGAYVVVAPRPEPAAPLTAAAAFHELVQGAGSRPVIVVNPRLGADDNVADLCPAFHMQPLSFTFMADNLATELSRADACLMRCFPHEWTVLLDAERRREYELAAHFDTRPTAQELEGAIHVGVTRWRDRKLRRLGSESV